MSTSTPIVQEFLERYARSRNTFEPGVIDSQYPDAFMFAGPDGARVVDTQSVLAGLTKWQVLFRSLGHKSTNLVASSEAALDEHYTMVRARFVWRFEKTPANPIDVDVDSTFILFTKDASASIVFQHEHEDFQQALRNRGVLPAPPVEGKTTNASS